MTNFQRIRNRILYSQNKYETYSTKEHKDKIKRPSNPRGTYSKRKMKKLYYQSTTLIIIRAVIN